MYLKDWKETGKTRPLWGVSKTPEKGVKRSLPASTMCYCDSEISEVKGGHRCPQRAGDDSGERSPLARRGDRAKRRRIQRAETEPKTGGTAVEPPI
jgi:hypothetical protein